MHLVMHYHYKSEQFNLGCNGNLGMLRITKLIIFY